MSAQAPRWFRRLFVGGFYVSVIIALYFFFRFIMHRYFGGPLTLPDMTTTQFEWSVIFLLYFIYSKESECKCGKKD